MSFRSLKCYAAVVDMDTSTLQEAVMITATAMEVKLKLKPVVT